MEHSESRVGERVGAREGPSHTGEGLAAAWYHPGRSEAPGAARLPDDAAFV